jgi:hypothetical protein
MASDPGSPPPSRQLPGQDAAPAARHWLELATRYERWVRLRRLRTYALALSPDALAAALDGQLPGWQARVNADWVDDEPRHCVDVWIGDTLVARIAWVADHAVLDASTDPSSAAAVLRLAEVMDALAGEADSPAARCRRRCSLRH